jgi:hypothetical protein
MVTGDRTGVRDQFMDFPEATKSWQAEFVPGAGVTGRGEADATGGPEPEAGPFGEDFVVPFQ